MILLNSIIVVAQKEMMTLETFAHYDSYFSVSSTAFLEKGWRFGELSIKSLDLWCGDGKD